MGALLSIIGALGQFFKLVGVFVGLWHDAQMKSEGEQLQAGRDATQTLNEARGAIAARDAVVPLRPDGLRVDGTPDPDQRD